jgi:glycosyltransferase involved in cell wall biosynthesis
MKIWHVGAMPYPDAVDGVNATIWMIAQEQVSLGHQVSLLLDREPDDTSVSFANNCGINPIAIPANIWGYDSRLLKSLLSTQHPHLVHLHSVFLPRQATLAKRLVSAQIPYVITPHGGLDSQHGQAKKAIYNLLIERHRFAKAAAITVVTPKEAETIHKFVPRYRGIVRWVANPFDSQKLEKHHWQGNIVAKRVVFLGRFDVLHKGIDLLIEIARKMPTCHFHLYGSEDANTRAWLEKLKRDLPVNLTFHHPVFGTEKIEVLTQASLYIQMSRWEVFGISIAEAMALGLPCAIAGTLNLAEVFQKYDLGAVLPTDPQLAAAALQTILDRPDVLQTWSQKSRAFAYQHFHPKAVAQDYLNLYEEVLSR